MVSKLGDYYDHVSDWSKVALFYVVLWRCYRVRPADVGVHALALLLMTMHFGCQQVHTHDGSHPGKHETLDTLRPLCPYDSWIFVTRYFGSGTFQFLLLLTPWYFEWMGRRRVP